MKKSAFPFAIFNTAPKPNTGDLFWRSAGRLTPHNFQKSRRRITLCVLVRSRHPPILHNSIPYHSMRISPNRILNAIQPRPASDVSPVLYGFRRSPTFSIPLRTSPNRVLNRLPSLDLRPISPASGVFRRFPALWRGCVSVRSCISILILLRQD